MGWALETDPETLIATVARWRVHRRPARLCARWHEDLRLPGAGGLRRARQDHAATRRPGAGPPQRREARGGRRRRPLPARAQAGAGSTWRCATSPRTPSGGSARRATRPSTAPTAVPAPSSSPRRSGSATPSATSRSPASCAACTPTCRSTGSPRTRSPGCWRPRASASTPPARHLANESRHIESESAEHDLHCFHALRRMDEILAANFMLFHDVVRDERYDLWIGDEAWELDYYLHENPREKRVPFAWLTDFVGFLPMDDGGRAGELPDRRLQRRHGRPHRPSPRGPRPGPVRRQPRRHRRRAARAASCR